MGGGNKAVLVTQYNPADPVSTLEVAADTDIPEPRQGEVLVKMLLRPVNPSDIMRAAGLYGGPQNLPFVMGNEGVGTVESNGPGCTKYRVGQRVVGVPFGAGTYQQYLVAKEAALFPVSDAISDEVAAQFFVNPPTVYGLLKSLHVPKGEWVLQTAATSVLGRQLVQLAKHWGVRTINVVRRRDAVDELKALGADEVIVSTEEDIAARVKEITGGKLAWGAVDAVAGEDVAQLAASVRDEGMVLCYGALGGSTVSCSVLDLLARGVVITGFMLGRFLKGPDGKGALEEVHRLLAEGVMTPLSGKHFSLDAVKEAIAASTAPGQGGKVLLEG